VSPVWKEDHYCTDNKEGGVAMYFQNILLVFAWGVYGKPHNNCDMVFHSDAVAYPGIVFGGVNKFS
jgi:hypothetical protein